MIFHWFPDPLIATNTNDGFEVLVLAFATQPGTMGPDIWALCSKEDGELAAYPHDYIRLGFRYKRGQGWSEIPTEQEMG